VPVLLDGAQGVGAVPVDVAELGCQFYSAAGQKWLCGPIGSGLLWVAPEWQERLPSVGPTYMNLAEPGLGLDAVPHDDARRHDTAAVSAEASAFAVAAHDVMAGLGWDAALQRAADLAEQLADALRERGHEVAPRGRTTLVGWRAEDAATVRDRAAEAGVTIRDLPGRGMLRASVGAWSDESDLERLLAVLA
ncbi:MAG TPA: aminotransferase class V-fold PLP-dependent enzyme, partial [Capillimicrobium sp.]